MKSSVNMADLAWRAKAIIAASLDLALISISLAVYAVTKNAFALVGATNRAASINIYGDNYRVHIFYPDFQDRKEIVEGNTPSAILVVALIGLIAVVNGLQIWAAVKLLNASEIETEPKQALKNARFWRVITTLVLLSTLYGMGSSSSTADILAVTIFTIWRGVHLYVISRFIKELEEIVASQTDAEPMTLLAKQ